MDVEATRKRLFLMLKSIASTHPEMRLDDVHDLVSVSEFRLALEILCENIVEDYGWICPTEAYEELVSLAHLVRLDPSYWQRMRPG